MPLLEIRQDSLDNIYFVWIEEDSQEVKILSEGYYVNVLKILEQALFQATKMPDYQQKSFKTGSNFTNLLENVPVFKDFIKQWVSNIGIKSTQELHADLDKIRISELSDQSGQKTHLNKDHDGHTALHRAIIGKKIPEIKKLLSKASFDALKTSAAFDALLVEKVRSGKPYLVKSTIDNKKSYLHYLVENLSLEEFKTIWEIHGEKLKQLAPLFRNSTVDNLFRNQQYDFADFLVSQGLNLRRSSNSSGNYTFGFWDPSSKKNPRENIYRFLNILEKQEDKISSELNLGRCFGQIFELRDQAILQEILNHPYILANQAIIDKFIRHDLRLNFILPAFSDESIWEYFLSRRTLHPTELSSLISETIRTGNLGLLCFLEKKGLYKISRSTLAEATELQASEIITYLITERKIDPCEKTYRDLHFSDYKLRYPICFIPQGTDSTKVIDAYAKAMGIEAFCKMMLVEPDSPLEYISGSYGVQQGSHGMSRDKSAPTLAAKNYIQENAPLSISMPFKFGELLANIVSDEANLELLCAGYHDERCKDFNLILDHINEYKDELFIYGPHKKALNNLISQTAKPQTKRLSEEGMLEVLAIADILQGANMDVRTAKEIGSKHFKVEADAPPVKSLDWSTKKAFIENPKKIKEINVLRRTEGLPLLGEQFNRTLSNTMVDPEIRAGWYLPPSITPIIKPAPQSVAKLTPGTVKINYVDYTKDEGRLHFYHEVSSDKNFKSNGALRAKYKGLKGDNLKSRILDNFKNRINEVGDRQALLRLKDELLNKDNPETEVLRQAQGAIFSFFSCFGLQTTSMDALEDMLAQRAKDFPAPEIQRC